NVELVAGRGGYKDFSGVLYVGADDGVLRKSKSVPLCECKMMTVWRAPQEECEKAFDCGKLEVLGISTSFLRQVPDAIGKMEMLQKL
ncbi:hypothetical protein, partial [Vibrio vulnificus]|uniref:hypothetical protein n=1 Tax=Vibrio vulnificus TaxID=672 RepID=UPI0019D4810E